MNHLRVLVILALLCAALAPAPAARAQNCPRRTICIHGKISGTFTYSNVNVIFDGPTTLVGNLTITLYDGTITIAAPIYGVEFVGQPYPAPDGFYEGAYPFTYHPPGNGVTGKSAFNLVLSTVRSGSRDVPTDIFINARLIFNGNPGQSGGAGASGFNAYDPKMNCVVLPARAPGIAGPGGNGGNIGIYSATDIYWRQFIFSDGGTGGNGGAGGGVGYIPAGVATDGAPGAAAGAGGDITFIAQGNIYYSNPTGLLMSANGGQPGNGGQGGGQAASNGVGGQGGWGGTAGSIGMFASNVLVDPQSTCLKLELLANAWSGGAGGWGGDGGSNSTCGCGCDGNSGCNRGPGAAGGMAGYPGNSGSIQVRVNDGGMIDFTPPLTALASVLGDTPNEFSAGTSGITGATYAAKCGACEHTLTPTDGTAGGQGVHGGLIDLEGGILNVPLCTLDARGGTGARGGGGATAGPSCAAGGDGGDGGSGGLSGPGGFVNIFVTTINGAGGQIFICQGVGGPGGNGGCAHGSGGPGGEPAQVGTCYLYAQYGIAPIVLDCIAQPGTPGNSCP